MPKYLLELPDGYTITAVLDHSNAVQVWEIRNGDAHAGYIIGLEWLAVVEWLPPDVPPVEPPNVVYYECQIAKLNIRLEPDSHSADKGDILLGQKVGVVAVVTEGDEVWGRLESGYYAAIAIGANVYLSKVTTGG